MALFLFRIVHKLFIQVYISISISISIDATNITNILINFHHHIITIITTVVATIWNGCSFQQLHISPYNFKVVIQVILLHFYLLANFMYFCEIVALDRWCIVFSLVWLFQLVLYCSGNQCYLVFGQSLLCSRCVVVVTSCSVAIYAQVYW